MTEWTWNSIVFAFVSSAKHPSISILLSIFASCPRWACSSPCLAHLRPAVAWVTISTM